MKNKLKFLIKQSLGKKVKTKWFKIANVILLICLLALANIDRIVTFFGGDFEKQKEILVIDKLGMYDSFNMTFSSLAESLGEVKNFKVQESSQEKEKLMQELDEKEDKIIITLNRDEKEYINAELISYNPIDTITYQLISTTLNQLKSSLVLMTSGLTEEEIESLTSPVEVKRIVTNEEVEDAESKDMLSAGIIIIFILPFFFLITMLTQMIGAEINDEKSTRGMEIIISNVPPKIHFISKIISSTLFVIIQGLLLIFYALLAYGLRMLIGTAIPASFSREALGSISEIWSFIKSSGILNLLGQGLPFLLILFLASFLAYAILAGVLASMTTSIEDYQQLQSPLMIILAVGYYIAILASTFDGAIFVKIISFIPLLSFLVAPVLFLLGQTTLLELGISAAICVISCIFMFHYGLRIYKVGILNYSSTKLWKKIWTSAKKS